MASLKTKDEFIEQVGTKFQLFLTQEDSIEIELIDVDRVKDEPPYHSFSLVFVAPGKDALNSGLYSLKHKIMGEIELFLSPFSKDSNGLKIESVFSLLIED